MKPNPESSTPFGSLEPSELRATRIRSKATLCSTFEIVALWCRYITVDQRPLLIPVAGSGPQRSMVAFQQPARYWSRHVSLGSHYFTASPGWGDQVELATLANILRYLMSFRTRSFVWYVPFDEKAIAAGLESLGLTSCTSAPTRVLYLSRDYERVFARYNATIRNQVRQSYRRGITVRDVKSHEDIQGLHNVYMQW